MTATSQTYVNFSWSCCGHWWPSTLSDWSREGTSTTLLFPLSYEITYHIMVRDFHIIKFSSRVLHFFCILIIMGNTISIKNTFRSTSMPLLLSKINNHYICAFVDSIINYYWGFNYYQFNKLPQLHMAETWWKPLTAHFCVAQQSKL